MKITSHQIDHLGLVSGVFDRLGIGKVIDSRLRKSRHHKVPHSSATKAMVLNGLGFLGQRLYLYPEYYEKVPVSKLIGGDIQPSISMTMFLARHWMRFTITDQQSCSTRLF